MSLVLFISLLNLGLGFGLAVGCVRLLNWTPASPHAATAEHSYHAFGDVELAVEELPSEWRELLSEVETPTSLVEASVQVLRLEVGKYREQLVAIDAEVRSCLTAPTVEIVHGCVERLQALNLQWLTKQSKASEQLQACQADDANTMAQALDEILLEQAAQIETSASNLQQLDADSEPQRAASRLIAEIRLLLDMAHRLRDRMQECLAEIQRQADRLWQINPQSQRDPLTGIVSRVGFEAALAAAWHKDSAGGQGALALLDPDRWSRLLEHFGAPATDALLTTIARLVGDEGERAGDGRLTARISGQRLAILVLNNGPQYTLSAAERCRQLLAATTYELFGQEIELSVSAGVAQVQPGDTVETLMNRAARALRKAKAAGRNRTYLDTGSGPAPIEPPQYDLPQRVLTVYP